MSYREWCSTNGRGKLLIYSDGMLFRFDMLNGSGATRLENVMVVHENRETGLRQIIIAEQCIVSEDGARVYMYLRGRIVHHTEPLSTRDVIPVPRRERHPIGVYNY
jgi:hypothetical protein